jgi:hypothetical protein
MPKGKGRATSCVDCGSGDLGWNDWSSSGPHRCRCRPCYLSYTRAKQLARRHGCTYKDLPAGAQLHGPPKPRPSVATPPTHSGETSGERGLACVPATQKNGTQSMVRAEDARPRTERAPTETPDLVLLSLMSARQSACHQQNPAMFRWRSQGIDATPATVARRDDRRHGAARD